MNINPKIIFKKQEYNNYKILQLSEDRLLNFIAKLLSNDSGTDWIKQELLKWDVLSNKENFEEIQTSGYIISCEHPYCCEDDITIIDQNALCEKGWFDEKCTEPNCCSGANKEKLEFSKSKLIELLDEWEKLNNLKPESIELSRTIYNNKFELKAL